jgi:hypothetical protein
MALSLIIVGLIIIAIAFQIFQRRSKIMASKSDIGKVSQKTLPFHTKQNDKLVLIENADYADVQKALTDFCNMYNEKTYQALPRLIKLSEKEFAIIFPYDLDFEIYCYFVNYMKYPIGIKWNANIVGWVTASTNDWIPEQSLNKKIMLFVPEDDTEGDNVYMTTSDNTGYKLGFAMGQEKKLLDTPKKNFRAPGIEIEELINKEFEDFK